MCFSANASFSAGIVLTVIGIATLKKVRRPSHILFAAIPLIFAVQQIAEGVLWVTLPHPESVKIQKVFTNFFLFFAEVVWPVWVPVAILLLEKEPYTKNVQKIFVAAGLLVGFYLAYCLLMYPVQAEIVGKHIEYKLDFPRAFWIGCLVLYGLATIIPSFFSPVKRMWLLGVAISISYIISAIFYEHYVLSVWCFFASIISISVYVIMLEINKDDDADIAQKKSEKEINP